MKKLHNFTNFLLESEKRTFDNIEGSSSIVIVATHGVDEDDDNTKEISIEMAKNLNAFCLINDKFHKPCNDKCENDEDFNHLPPFNGKEYEWDKRVPEMKVFYETLESYAKKASSLSKDNNKRCLVLFIHGLKHDKYDIDLGAGVKSAPNMVINAEQHKKAKENTGDVTAPIKFVETFKEVLEKKGLKVGTGAVFSAWDEQNGGQYLKTKGLDCYTIQVEINANLRKDIKKTADLLSICIKQMTDFSEPILDPIKQK